MGRNDNRHSQASWIDALLSNLRNEAGNVTATIAIMLVPLVGAIGIGSEVASWHMVQRSEQHAADAAAVAAAVSAYTTSDSDYAEGKAVASKYGYVDGSRNVTVVIQRAQTCPAPNAAYNDCYRATVTKLLQIRLPRLVGFSGDVPLGAGRGKRIIATAVARPRGTVDPFCYIGLGQNAKGESVRANGGGSSLNWNGCTVFGNYDVVCNGSGADRGMPASYAHGSSSCAAPKNYGSQPTISDPYYTLATTQIDAAKATAASTPGCNAAHTITAADKDKTFICSKGDMTLGASVAFTQSKVIMLIDGGDLVLGGKKTNYTLSTVGGTTPGGMTIMFTGSSGGATKGISGPGTLDIAGPTSGLLSGFALMQDPRLATASMTFAGNSPTIDMTGIAYMPKMNVTVSGTIHFKTGGYHCLGLVANSFLINGNDTIADDKNTQCTQAGVTLPTLPGTSMRAALLQ